jgi:hypothetical protein
MSLRTARVGDHVASAEQIDERVCDCCQTAAAATAAGPLVAFRDRSAAEVRDIAIARRAGAEWTAPAPVAADGWKLPGCPVSGPAVAAQRRAVVVAWFTGAGPAGPRVQTAFSTDAGASFGRPLLIDGDRPLGRVDVALEPGGAAVVAWLALVGDEAELRLARAAPGGKVGPALPIARTSAARASGFPRLGLVADRLYLAWVEVGDDRAASRLRAASLPLSAVP